MAADFGKRFKELLEQAHRIEAGKKQQHSEFSGAGFAIDDHEYLNWKVKVRHLLVSACGEKSQHITEFNKAEPVSMYSSEYEAFKRLMAVFLAAKEDYEGGYLNTIRYLIQAEVFESELEQAEELFKSGYIAAAAVISRVVLETGVRQLCTDNGIGHGKLDKMNADLAKAGVYNSLTQKQVTSHAAVGNAAAHGKTSEYTSTDVQHMIQGIRSFLAIHLT